MATLCGNLSAGKANNMVFIKASMGVWDVDDKEVALTYSAVCWVDWLLGC